MVVIKYVIGFFLLLFMAIEWALDMCVKLVTVVHKCFEDITVALLKKYNEFNS